MDLEFILKFILDYICPFCLTRQHKLDATDTIFTVARTNVDAIASPIASQKPVLYCSVLSPNSGELSL
jgi:hypothetical protein